MKKIVLLLPVAFLLFSVYHVNDACKPCTVKVSTSVGEYTVVLTDNDFISLPPLALERELKSLIETVAASNA